MVVSIFTDGYSGHFIYIESYNAWCFMTGSFHLIQGSSML